MAVIRRLLGDESGQALVEYALILSIVSIAGVVTLGVIGGDLSTMISNVASKL